MCRSLVSRYTSCEARINQANRACVYSATFFVREETEEVFAKLLQRFTHIPIIREKSLFALFFSFERILACRMVHTLRARAAATSSRKIVCAHGLVGAAAGKVLLP